jgi:hypothetical protein
MEMIVPWVGMGLEVQAIRVGVLATFWQPRGILAEAYGFALLGKQGFPLWREIFSKRPVNEFNSCPVLTA